MNKSFHHYWGIDVSKSWLDISINNKVIRIEQTEDEINQFIKDHYQEQTLVVVESTGGYENLIVRSLDRARMRVHIAHPNKVKAFSRAKGKLAKTDKIDAKILSEYGQFIKEEEIRELPSEKQVYLQDLGARLEQLKEFHHQESCRLGIATGKFIRGSIEMILSSLKGQILLIEQEVMSLITQDVELKEKYDLLRSMKGVGPVLAMSLITSLPELGHANKKEIAALVGVAPITQESGRKIGRATTRYGRNEVRKKLYMGALVASRRSEKFKVFYERLVASGKPKKVALVAVMRKMIVILNAMLQSKTPFFT
jgi:transposase